jgi:hypothetical protein
MHGAPGRRDLMSIRLAQRPPETAVTEPVFFLQNARKCKVLQIRRKVPFPERAAIASARRSGRQRGWVETASAELQLSRALADVYTQEQTKCPLASK